MRERKTTMRLREREKAKRKKVGTAWQKEVFHKRNNRKKIIRIKRKKNEQSGVHAEKRKDKHQNEK